MSKKLWMLILTVFAVLLCSCRSVEEPKQPVDAKAAELYQNVDGCLYRGDPKQVVRRTPEEDGFYTVTFARDGSQQRLRVTPEAMEKGLDVYDVVGLIIDENGTVTDFQTVEQCTGGYAVKNYYVEEIDGQTVYCNNAPAFDGYKKAVTVTDSTQILRASGAEVLTGTYTTINVNDRITAVCDKNGAITHVFTEPLRELPDIYWNIERQYDSAIKATSRASNELGIYEFQFALNGQIVTLKARDRAVATQVDAIAAKCMALTFDEEGYIETVTAASAATGGSFGSWFHITDIQDNLIITHKFAAGSDQGTDMNGVLAENFVAYDVSGIGPMGQPTELRVGDQIHCLKNDRNHLAIGFVVSRLVEADVYWNVDRHYDADTQETTRKPDKDGWYHIVLAVNGQQVTLKTKDRAIVNTMDGRNDMHFALNVADGVITACYKPSAPFGGTFFASWCNVTDIGENGVVTALKSGSDTPEQAKLAPDCKIYYVGNMHYSHKGEPTDLRVGDLIHGERNLKGEIVLLYVVGGRLADSPMYWNIDRQWDTEKGESARQPDEDGWYKLLLAAEGKQLAVRTRDKALVDQMEKSAAAAFGLQLDGDVVKKVYTPNLVSSGSGWSSWCDVMEIGEYDFVTTKRVIAGDNQGMTYTARMDWNCKVYNVSNTYVSHKGEQAELWTGDRVQCYLDKEGDIEYIFIISRNPTDDRPDHFHCVCGGTEPGGHTCGEDAGWTPWTNSRSLPARGTWYLTTDVTLAEPLTILADTSLRICLNGHTINGQTDVNWAMLRLYGKLTVTDCQPEQGHIIANTGAYGSVLYQFDSSPTVMELYAGHLSSSLTTQERNGGIVYIGEKGTEKAVFNMYGGTVTGLEVIAGRGGTVTIIKNHEFNMYGGVISGGSAPNGGNIDLYGTFNMYGGLVTGGTTTSTGGNIYIASGILNLYGGMVSGGTTSGSGGNIYMAAGTINMEGGSVADGTSVGSGGNICADSGKLYLRDGAAVTRGYGKSAGGIWLKKGARMDMYEGAVLSDSCATGEGGNLQINSGASFYMHGGVISGGGRWDGKTLTTIGGNVNVFGTIHMYGGVIEDGCATNQGGNIGGYGSFVLNMEGNAIIRKGSAPTGGNVALRGTAPQLNMAGGSITEGETCISAGTVKLSGTVCIQRLYLASGTMTAENLDGTSAVGIAMKTPGLFLSGGEAYLSIFTSCSDSYEVLTESGGLKLQKKGV